MNIKKYRISINSSSVVRANVLILLSSMGCICLTHNYRFVLGQIIGVIVYNMFLYGNIKIENIDK